MLLRMLREPGSGRPAPLTRLLALIVVLGMIALSAPVLIPVVAWLIGLIRWFIALL